MATIYCDYSQSTAKVSLSAFPQCADQTRPVRLEYLNEGNANVVYRFRPLRDGGDIPVALQGKLLRLRKNKPFIRRAQDQYTAFKTHFLPLFPEGSLVEHDLVVVDQSILISLNTVLHQLEKAGNRPLSRHGDVLATDDLYGLLVTNMTAPIGETFLELKPKWLVQSPDAPRDAVRCRTCALRAQRQEKMAKRGETPTCIPFCPLRLVSGTSLDRRKVFEAVALNQGLTLSEPVLTAISALAKEVLPVLRNLQRHQAKLDCEGIVKKDISRISNQYLMAMTLRDCILLIKGSQSDSGVILEARLGDLDLKQNHPEKVLHWQKTEIALIREGWYTNTESHAVPEQVCLLAPKMSD